MITLTYIWHDCFVLQTSEAAVVFDFWLDGGRPDAPDGNLPDFFSDIPEGKPVYVLVSHHHKDHYTRRIFEWGSMRQGIHYVLSRDTAKAARPYISPDSIYKGVKADPSSVSVVRPGEKISLPGLSVKAYGSTDIGNSWVVESGGISAMHAGDLNAWIWKDESTDKEVEEALNAFTRILHTIAADYPRLDICMFPVDSRIGTDYWTGASLTVRAIDVARFFPMHFELADTPDERERRHKDAMDFASYANQKRGEYIALMAPYSKFGMADDLHSLID